MPRLSTWKKSIFGFSEATRVSPKFSAFLKLENAVNAFWAYLHTEAGQATRLQFGAHRSNGLLANQSFQLANERHELRRFGHAGCARTWQRYLDLCLDPP